MIAQVLPKTTMVKDTHNLELLDTPGVLWPKFTDQRVGEHLAMTAIKDQLINLMICVDDIKIL